MVAQALQESLSDYARQGKDGRNVVVKQFRKRLAKVTSFIAQCQSALDGFPQENFTNQQAHVLLQQMERS
jgi:hypothetical protein